MTSIKWSYPSFTVNLEVNEREQLHGLCFNIRKSQIWISSSIEGNSLIHSTFDVQYEYQGRIRERTLNADINIRQSWLQPEISILHRYTLLCIK